MVARYAVMAERGRRGWWAERAGALEAKQEGADLAVAAGGFSLSMLLIGGPRADEMRVGLREFCFRDEDGVVHDDAGFVWQEAYEVVVVAVFEDGVRC